MPTTLGALVLILVSALFSAADLRPSLVAISVQNLDQSVHWYTDTLNFKVQETIDLPESKLRITFLERNNFRLELIELKDSFPIRRYVPDLTNRALLQGFSKLAFDVDDLRGTAA